VGVGVVFEGKYWQPANNKPASAKTAINPICFILPTP